jgi:hypothetical protein
VLGGLFSGNSVNNLLRRMATSREREIYLQVINNPINKALSDT